MEAGLLPVSHSLNPQSLKVPTFCLVLGGVYGLCDKLRDFVFGIFIPQYHYQYPVALSFGQVLVTLLFLNLLHVLDLVRLQPYSRTLAEKILVPAVCLSVQDVVVVWAKASSLYCGLHPHILLLLPSATAGFSYWLKLPSLPSVHVSVLIGFLSGTSFVLTVSSELSSLPPLEYVYAPLSVLLLALSLTFLAKVVEVEQLRPPEARASVLDVYYAQTLTQSCVLGPLWLLHPDGPWRVLSSSSWTSLLFLGYLLALLLLSSLLNLTVGAAALCVSPFAAAVLHSARHLMRPFFHLL